jgi:hypothetical protein
MHWRDAMPRVLPGGGESPQLENSQARRNRAPRSKTEKQPQTKALGRLWFAPAAPPAAANPEKTKRPPKPKGKNNPQHIAAARELRDRYLEQVNSGNLLLPQKRGKYHVARLPQAMPKPMPLIAA